MIELQSVGLRFGLATKAESYKQNIRPALPDYLNALRSAVEESVNFWELDFSEIHPIVMPNRLLCPWQILGNKAPMFSLGYNNTAPGHNIFIVPLSVIKNDDTFSSWHYQRLVAQDGELENSEGTVSRYSGIFVYQGQSMLTKGDGYIGEGLYCVVIDDFIVDIEKLEYLGKTSFVVSEPFSFSNDVSAFVEFLYQNENTNPNDIMLKDNYAVDFTGGYFFRMFIPTQIGQPNYVFEEVISERMGYKYVESQTSKKTYNLRFPATESMCDNLRIAKLCSYKMMKSKDKYYNILAMDMEVNWLEQGNIADVSLTIETDDVINTTGQYLRTNRLGDFNDKAYNPDFYDVKPTPAFTLRRMITCVSADTTVLNLEFTGEQQTCSRYEIQIQPYDQESLLGTFGASMPYHHTDDGGGTGTMMIALLVLSSAEFGYTTEWRPGDYAHADIDAVTGCRLVLGSKAYDNNRYAYIRADITINGYND